MYIVCVSGRRAAMVGGLQCLVGAIMSEVKGVLGLLHWVLLAGREGERKRGVKEEASKGWRE